MVIKGFKHKGLALYFEKSDHRGIEANLESKIQRILDRLDASTKPEDMNLPGYKFHGLQGNRKGTYAVAVSGNWRITFKFEGGDAIDVNLEDYH